METGMTDIFMHTMKQLKNALEAKFGLNVYWFRGWIGNEMPSEVWHRDPSLLTPELQLTDTAESVRLLFAIHGIDDVRHIMDGQKIEHNVPMDNDGRKAKDEEYYEDEEYDDDDFVIEEDEENEHILHAYVKEDDEPMNMVVVVNVDSNGIILDATFEPCMHHCNRVYPELRKSIDAYLDEICTSDLCTTKITDNGTLHVLTECSFMEQCKVEQDYVVFINDFVNVEQGFRLAIGEMYNNLQNAICNIENVYSEPWLPMAALETESDGNNDKYVEAFAMMRECAFSEEDASKMFFMPIDSVEYVVGRRVRISGTVGGGSISRGETISGSAEICKMLLTVRITKDGEAIDTAMAGDNVALSLFYDDHSESFYDDFDGTLEYTIRAGGFICGGKVVKLDHKKLADMMNAKQYKPAHVSAVTTKIIRRKLMEGKTSGLLLFIAECMG